MFLFIRFSRHPRPAGVNALPRSLGLCTAFAPVIVASSSLCRSPFPAPSLLWFLPIECVLQFCNNRKIRKSPWNSTRLSVEASSWMWWSRTETNSWTSWERPPRPRYRMFEHFIGVYYLLGRPDHTPSAWAGFCSQFSSRTPRLLFAAVPAGLMRHSHLWSPHMACRHYRQHRLEKRIT